MNSTNHEELIILLRGCMKNDRESQKTLYRLFYGYAMSICIRYSKNQDEAVEVLNDGFMKVFTKIKKFDPEKYDPLLSFKGWLRKIMINTALDSYRANLKNYQNYPLDGKEETLKDNSQNALNELAYEDLIALVQQLSPVYRTVFNLYVVDGFTHEEIAGQLGISVGTSKSNLSKARTKLQEVLKKTYKDVYARYAG